MHKFFEVLTKFFFGKMNLIDTPDNDWKLKSIFSSKKSDRIHNRKRRVAKTKWLSNIANLMNFPDEEEPTENDEIMPKELPFLDEVHPETLPNHDDDDEDELLHTNLGFDDLDDPEPDSEDEEDEDSSSGEEEVFGSLAQTHNGLNQDNPDVTEELRQKLRERLEELKLKRQRKPEIELNGKRSVERRRKKDQQKHKKQQKKEKSKEFQKRLKESKQTGIFMDDDSQKKRKVEEDNFAYSTLVVNNGKATPSYLSQSPVSKKAATKKKIEELESLKNELKQKKLENPEEAKKMENDLSWKNAFDRTSGEKVKDDLTKLKKSLKAKEKKKQKSKEAWENREKQLEEKQKERQEKRKMNIREHSMKKKIKQLQRRGRAIPEKLRAGFEGKRKTVLNRKKN